MMGYPYQPPANDVVSAAIILAQTGLAFSPQMRALVNDILEKEHAKQLSRYLMNPPPYVWRDVDESALLSRKDDIERAAGTRGDRTLAELLTATEKWEKNGDESRAQECRKEIEHLLGLNGLGGVTLLRGR